MLCPYKVEANEIKAKLLTVNLGNDLQKYAINFLHIFNNAREHKDMVLKVGNNYRNNDVNVICKAKHVDSVKNYLEQFGEVTIEDCTAIQPVVYTDFDKWDEDIDYEYSEVVNAIED